LVNIQLFFVEKKKFFFCHELILVDGYFGDPQDCRVYHVCIDGRDHRSICAPGLAWESLLRLCMSAHLVNCPNSKSIDSSSKQKWLQFFTRPGVKTTTTTTTASTPILPSIFTCAGRVNGYYSDPVQCNKFHYCGTGRHSFIFNLSKKFCFLQVGIA
jgi:hypothetical protein